MQDLEGLKVHLRQFAKEREWDQFHSPKNLSMALIVEAGELVEHFQWLTEEQSKSLDSEKLQSIGEELADIQIYLVRIADKLGINISDAVQAKMEKNAKKYPSEMVKGSAKKYNEY